MQSLEALLSQFASCTWFVGDCLRQLRIFVVQVMTQLAKAKAAFHELSSLLDELKLNNLMLTAENEKRLGKYVFYAHFRRESVCDGL